MYYSTWFSFSLMPEKPTNFNIVYLDDVGFGDIALTGAIGYSTPNLDKIAASGMFFSHYYSPQAVCSASRAGLFTGCYPNRVGFHGALDHTAKMGINADEETIAEVLKKKGYATAAFGKWHLGHLKQFLPTHNGFDEYLGIPYSNDMWPNHPTGKNYYPLLPLIEGDEVVATNPDQSKFTTEFIERTINFIKKNQKNRFFIYLAHPMAHLPLFVSDKFKGKSTQGLYGVPCLMMWKGTISAGTVNNDLIAGMDILPTLAEIAGATLPEKKIDGVNILPLMKGEQIESPRKSMYYYYRNKKL